MTVQTDTSLPIDNSMEAEHPPPPSQLAQRQLAARIGFWSALLSGLLAVAWVLTFVAQNMAVSPSPWRGIEAYAQSYNPLEMLNLVPALLLPWPIISMLVGLHYFVTGPRRVWTHIALAFIVVYAVLAATNYLIQLVVVHPALLNGETDGLAAFVGFNRPSVFRALANAYAIQSGGLLFAGLSLANSRPEAWARRLFVFAGLSAPIQVGYSLGLVPEVIGLAALGVWIAAVPVGCFLLATVFRRGRDSRPV